MGKIINYNKRNIGLYYTDKSLSKIELNDSIIIQTNGSGKGKDYNQVEQEAQLYLIRNAINNKPKKKLDKIVGIMQNITYDGIELKIILEGTAIFK